LPGCTESFHLSAPEGGQRKNSVANLLFMFRFAFTAIERTK
jgi:hypothetical protein